MKNKTLKMLFWVCMAMQMWIVSSLSHAVPNVTVASITGPIPVTAESGEPFRGAHEQPVPGPGLPIPILEPFGYVEEEYFVHGTVDGAPYKTSLLVRKPSDPQKFSGLVAVETIHRAGAIPFWGVRKVWLNGGHGWVAVASQKTSLEDRVKAFNPERYASLSVQVADGDPSGGEDPQDAVSQAIMTQVGALLKSNLPEGPFAGMNVKYLIMGGASQTGGTTLRYISQSHEKARMPDGSPIYDGYSPKVAFTEVPPSASDAAIVHSVTEGDIIAYIERERPMVFGVDRDEGARYRHYQIPGASHVPTRGIQGDPKEIYPSAEGLEIPEGFGLSQFPQAELGIRPEALLVEWVMNGVAPPKSEPLKMADGKIARDEYGNAEGGLRTPWVDLPTVSYIAGPQHFGLEKPLPAELLRAKYGSWQAYLEKFNRQIDDLVVQGWLFPDQAEQLKEEEAERELF